MATYTPTNAKFAGALGANANTGVLYTVPTGKIAKITSIYMSGVVNGAKLYLKLNSTSVDASGAIIRPVLAGAGGNVWITGNNVTINMSDLFIDGNSLGLYLKSGDTLSVSNASGFAETNVSAYISIIEETQ